MEELKKRFVKQGYNLKSIDKHVLHVKALEKEAFKKKKDKYTQSKIFQVLTSNQFLPSIANIVSKHWNIRNIITTLQHLFQEDPVTDFQTSRSLKKLIGSAHIETGKVKWVNRTFNIGKCSTTLSKTWNMGSTININNDIYQPTNKRKT